MTATIEGVTTQRRRPATPSQRRLVLAAALRPDDPSTNWAVLARLPDSTDPERFATTVEEVMSSYDAFAEHFELTRSGRIDAVLQPRRHHCPIRAFDSLRALRRYAGELADTPFDLTAPPLYRTEIAVVDGNAHLVVVGAHVLSDGFGFFNIITDLAAHYSDPGYVSKYTDSPTDIIESYQVPRATVVEYFRSLFGDMSDLTIPGWNHRDPRGRIPGTVTRHPMGRERYDRVGDRAAEWGVSRYALLLTAYALTVGALSDQESIVIATPMSNRRSGPRAAHTRGLRVNALPVRADLGPASVLGDLAEQMHRQVAMLKEYEQHSFADFAREVVGDESIDATQPSVGFSLYPRPLAPVVEGVEGIPLTVDRRWLQHSVTMFLEVADSDVTLILERSNALAEIDVAALYGRVLDQLLGCPAATPLGDLQWTDDSTTSTVPATRTYPAATIIDLIDSAVGSRCETGTGLAVIAPDASLTRSQLTSAYCAVAAWLLDPGVGVPVGTRYVAVRTEPSAAWLAITLGVMRAGMIAVPIDAAWPAARCAQIAETLPGLVLLESDAAGAAVTDTLPRIPGMTTARLPSRLTDGSAHETPGDRLTDAPLPAPGDTAYVVFTSGTTGVPKAVPTRHESAAHFLTGFLDRSGIRNRRWSLLHSPAFDISIAESLGAILGGGAVVIPDPRTRRDPGALGDWLREHHVEVVCQTPSAFTMNGASLMGVESLKAVLLCGERLDPAQLAPAISARPDVDFVNCYGITETTVHHTTFVQPHRVEDLPTVSVIGRPLDHVTMTVLDRHHRMVPRGVVGEFAVAGPGLMDGYLGAPELTAACTTVVGGERYYLTGDLGYLDVNADFTVLGRTDHQVKIRGHRCELGDVAAAVLGTGRVSSVRVVTRGEGLAATLGAAVVPAASEADPASGEFTAGLRARLREMLPTYFVPETIVVLPALPTNANGKVDAHEVERLVDEAAARRERGAGIDVGDGDSSDGVDVAAVVRAAWADALGHSDFGDDDRFFDAGGTSALVISVSQMLEARLGLEEFDVVDFFDHPTPRSLTEFLAAEVAAQ